MRYISHAAQHAIRLAVMTCAPQLPCPVSNTALKSSHHCPTRLHHPSELSPSTITVSYGIYRYMYTCTPSCTALSSHSVIPLSTLLPICANATFSTSPLITPFHHLLHSPNGSSRPRRSTDRAATLPLRQSLQSRLSGRHQDFGSAGPPI